MTRYIFACYLSLFCLCRGTFGQVAKGQQPPAPPAVIDSKYMISMRAVSAFRIVSAVTRLQASGHKLRDWFSS
jgi:hypothetical protein